MSEHDIDRLLKFLSGDMSEQEAKALEDEIDRSKLLQILLIDLIRNDSLLGENTRKEASVQDLLLFRGEKLGRYIILEIIGSGSMGIVYSAYDPKLERKVAIKLIRPGLLTEESSKQLSKEARAASAISHPNVVAVFDMDKVGSSIYIVMEYVRGATLDKWMMMNKPGVHDIVDKFLQAAKGLEAAHAAGLIHRDFKPSNLIVGDDGRVRLTDFGLAQANANSGVSNKSGTPAYMASEQLTEGISDERSDQYSLCVTLFEAICGKRPGIPKEKDDTASEDLWIKEYNNIPRFLRRVLQRGLEKDPDKRFSSMHDLIRALQPVRRLRTVWGISIAILVAGLLLISQIALPGKEPCTDGSRRMATIWNPEIKAATLAGKNTINAIDSFAWEWKNIHTKACRATRIEGTQSEHLLAARYFCLETRLSDFQALIIELSQENGSNSSLETLDAAGILPDLRPCSDSQALIRIKAASWRELLAPQWSLALTHLNLAAAMAWTGHREQALMYIDKVVEQIRKIRSGKLRAELLFRLGRLHAIFEDTETALRILRKAMVSAAGAHDDWLMAQTSVQYMEALNTGSQNLPEIGTASHITNAILERIENDTLLHARLENISGEPSKPAGNIPEAQAGD